MKIIIGLGNPGSRYEQTRHNIGWMVIDAIARALRTEFRAGRGDYYQATGTYAGQDVMLVKPSTYMNLSGDAAGQIVERYGVPTGDILVIVDEYQFAVGRIQLKPSGSDSGHNGMASVIDAVQSRDIPRLRCGIGSDFEHGEMVGYVLSRFPAAQSGEVERMIAAARDAALCWVAEGMSRAMSLHNVRPKAGDIEKNTAPSEDGGEQTENSQ